MVKRRPTAREKTKSDFKKRKRKVGKRAPAKINATPTSFTVKKLLVTAQSILDDKRNAQVTQRRLTLEELLNRTSHHNADSRKDAFIGLKQLLSLYPHLLVHHLGFIIHKVMLSATDEEQQVRHAVFLLLSFIFETCHPEMIAPFIHLIQNSLSSLMSHVRKSLRRSSIVFFKLCLKHFAHLLWVPQDAIKILPNLSGLLLDGIKSGKRLLTNQKLKKKKGDAESILGILECISKYMEHCSLFGEKKIKNDASVDSNTEEVSHSWQQYCNLIKNIIRPQSEQIKKDNSKNQQIVLARSSIINVNTDSKFAVNAFIATVTPALIGFWVENLPSSDDSTKRSRMLNDDDSIRINCLNMIARSIYIFLQIQLRQNKDFISIYAKDLMKHIFLYFPLVPASGFTPNSRYLTNSTNDKLCSIMVYFFPLKHSPVRCHKGKPTQWQIQSEVTVKYTCFICKKDITPGNFVFKCTLCPKRLCRCIFCYNKDARTKAFESKQFGKPGEAMLKYLHKRLGSKTRKLKKKKNKASNDNTAIKISELLSNLLEVLKRLWLTEQLILLRCFSELFMVLPNDPINPKKECILFIVQLLQLKDAKQWVRVSGMGIAECIRSLPSCLYAFGNKDPSCSAMILRLLLNCGRHSSNGTSQKYLRNCWAAYSYFDFDTLQPILVDFFSSTPDYDGQNDIINSENVSKKSPFSLLQISLQKQTIELLYYFNRFSNAMLLAIISCCKDAYIDLSIRCYLVEVVFHNRRALKFSTLLFFLSSICLFQTYQRDKRDKRDEKDEKDKRNEKNEENEEKKITKIVHKMHILPSFDANNKSITNTVCQCITNLITSDDLEQTKKYVSESWEKIQQRALQFDCVSFPSLILRGMTPACIRVFSSWTSSDSIYNTDNDAQISHIVPDDVYNAIKIITCCLVCIQNSLVLNSSISSSSTLSPWALKLPPRLSVALPLILLRSISSFVTSDSNGMVSIIIEKKLQTHPNALHGPKCVQLCFNILSICPDLIDQFLSLLQNQIIDPSCSSRLVCTLILILREDTLRDHLLHLKRKKIALNILKMQHMFSSISSSLLSTLKSEYAILFDSSVKTKSQ